MFGVTNCLPVIKKIYLALPLFCSKIVFQHVLRFHGIVAGFPTAQNAKGCTREEVWHNESGQKQHHHAHISARCISHAIWDWVGALKSALGECIAVADLDFALRQKWALLFVSSGGAARVKPCTWNIFQPWCSARLWKMFVPGIFSLVALEIIFSRFTNASCGRFISHQKRSKRECVKRLKGLSKF